MGSTPELANPWLVDSAVVVSKLGSEVDNGLSQDEAALLLERLGHNVLDPKPPVLAWRKLLRQFADPLVGLLLVAVAISLVTWLLEGTPGIPFERS